MNLKPKFTYHNLKGGLNAWAMGLHMLGWPNRLHCTIAIAIGLHYNITLEITCF